MTKTRRWLDRAIADSETLDLPMPWSRATRPARAAAEREERATADRSTTTRVA